MNNITPLYLDAEVHVVERICESVKADGTRCTTNGVKMQIDGTKVSLCGTHLNKLNRDHKITLHNGEVVEDEEYPEIQAPIKGDVTIISAEELNNKVEIVPHTNEKEGMMDEKFIYHFLENKIEDGEEILPRIITTVPRESEVTRFNQSLLIKRPIDGLLALSIGTWDFHLLRHRLVNKGHDFRIMILSNKEVRKLSPERIALYADRATFVYANDSHSYFIRVEGAEYGLEVFGLIEKDTPKLGKRFAEICRASEFGYHSDEMDINVLIREPVGDPKHYDGMNYMSLHFALKVTDLVDNKKRRRYLRKALMEGVITRLNLRVETPTCVIKGDVIVVKGLSHDLVVYPENCKGELRTNGWCLVTMTPHDPLHMAVWDTQTWVNNRTVLPESKQRRDVDLTMKDLRESFEKGVVPDWLLLGEELHDDSGLPDYERLSQLMNRQYIYWQAHDLDIKAAQNLVFMATNGLVKRMERELRTTPLRYYRKTWTRMSNAFLAGVVTRDSLLDMGHIGDTRDDDGYLAFDHRFGLVLSGERFATTYSLHGGWDLDDSVKVILIKIWSSDPNRTLMMLESGALDPKCVVRAKAEEATPVAFLVRSPNGPGEYSIEALNPETWQDMPWFGFDENLIPLVDLAVFPDPQPELLKNVTITGIPTSLVHTGLALTREQGMEMVEAQRFNPGIGMICNCLMNWVMTMGASFPPNMLALLEQMVDTTQQLRDPVSFQAVMEEVNNLYQQMVNKVVTENKAVDGLLAIAHPIPDEFADEMRAHMRAGRFSRFNTYFGYQVDKLKQEVMNNSLQMRHILPLVNTIRNLPVSPTTLQWAKEFNYRYTQEFALNQRLWTHRDEERNPFAAMHFELMRSQANKETVARAVAELKDFGGTETHKRVLSLWHWILKMKPGRPFGDYDRLIFQPGMDISIMHLLVDALVWRGLATAMPLHVLDRRGVEVDEYADDDREENS